MLETGELQSPYLTNEQHRLIKTYRSEDILWVSNPQKERELQEIFCYHIWPDTKFLKGEGITSYRKSISGQKILILRPIFGKSHERPDLTAGKSCGCPWIVLCIWGHEHRIIEQKGMCWKTYE
jgi:hypothetical protein